MFNGNNMDGYAEGDESSEPLPDRSVEYLLLLKAFARLLLLDPEGPPCTHVCGLSVEDVMAAAWTHSGYPSDPGPACPELWTPVEYERAKKRFDEFKKKGQADEL